jgi:hypothetical protein
VLLGDGGDQAGGIEPDGSQGVLFAHGCYLGAKIAWVKGPACP